jgi:hypothetical protein
MSGYGKDILWLAPLAPLSLLNPLSLRRGDVEYGIRRVGNHAVVE